MKLTWSKEAVAQLLAYVDYIAEDNPLAALEVETRIHNVAHQLLEFPYMGRTAPASGCRMFSIPHLPFTVVYRIQQDNIEIVTVWHDSRNPQH